MTKKIFEEETLMAVLGDEKSYKSGYINALEDVWACIEHGGNWSTEEINTILKDLERAKEKKE